MSIQYTVLGTNPRPSEHESPPITTSPGLPTQSSFLTQTRIDDISSNFIVYLCLKTSKAFHFQLAWIELYQTRKICSYWKV